MKPMMWMACCAAVLLSSAAPLRAQTTPTRVTVLDGRATLVRGITQSPAVLGMALKDGDIIESAADTALLRLEFADKSALELGPSARLWLGRPPGSPASGGAAAKGYLLLGWAKLSVGADARAATALDTPHGLLQTQGNSLMEARAASASFFAETGDARITARRGVTSLAAGQYLSIVKADATPAPPSAAPPAWLKGVPAALKDKLPPRRDRFDGKEIAVPAGATVRYADIEPWLQAESRIRSALLPRWKPLARDPRFKADVVANMKQHPEWDRVLFPEKYAPPPVNAPTPAR
jgi:hypothetical protein